MKYLSAFYLFASILCQNGFSQNTNTFDETTSNDETSHITKTLLDYIEGTASGQPERLRKAFHKDMNLYSIDKDSLKVLSGETYIGYYKPGQKRNRLGKIISIDYVHDAAMAKLEIDYPSRKILYTDYLLLLKVHGQWKIIHKSYTSISY